MVTLLNVRCELGFEPSTAPGFFTMDLMIQVEHPDQTSCCEEHLDLLLPRSSVSQHPSGSFLTGRLQETAADLLTRAVIPLQLDRQTDGRTDGRREETSSHSLHNWSPAFLKNAPRDLLQISGLSQGVCRHCRHLRQSAERRWISDPDFSSSSV